MVSKWQLRMLRTHFSLGCAAYLLELSGKKGLNVTAYPKERSALSTGTLFLHPLAFIFPKSLLKTRRADQQQR
jgi:hypothetical protein